MSVYTVTPLGLAGSLKVIRDPDVDASTGYDLTDGAATLYTMIVDNTAVATTTYVKCYNSLNPVIGTAVPDMVFMLPALTQRTITFATGSRFSVAISTAAVTTGGTGGTSSPGANVLVNWVVA